MRRQIGRMALIVGSAFVFLAGGIARAEGELGSNLVENGDCEAQDAEGTWGLDTPDRQQMMSEGAHGGKRCLKLICQEEGESARSGRDHKKPVKVDPAKIYRISCWAQVKGAGTFYLVVKSVTDAGIHHKPGEVGARSSMGVADTHGEWKKVELSYELRDAEKEVRSVIVSPRIRGKGEVLIDDVEVREETGGQKTAAIQPGVAEGKGLKLGAHPTIHSIGLRIAGVEEGIVSAKVEYRKESEPTWREALPLRLCLGNKLVEEGSSSGTAVVFADLAPMIRRLYGSLFHLEPDSVYEIRASLLDEKGGSREVLQAKARTRPNGVIYGRGRTLKVGTNEEYKTIQSAVKAAGPGDTILVAPGMYREYIYEWPSGRPGNPITLRGMKGAVLDGLGVQVPKLADEHTAINIKDGHDIIVEGFQIQRFDYHMFIDRCQRVVIQKNVIDGRVDPEKPRCYGLRIKRCQDCLIQFNVVLEPGQGEYTKYPYSIVENKGTVFRYNQVVGGVCGEMIAVSGSQEMDIYENLFRGKPTGDGMEIGRGPCINVRFWNNVIDCRDGQDTMLSIRALGVGPLYVFRNLFISSGNVVECANSASISEFAGHKVAGFGPVFLYHNTFVSPKASAKGGFFKALGAQSHLTLANNILLGKTLSYEAVTAAGKMGKESAEYAKVEADYNVYWEDAWKGKGALPRESVTPGLDEHSLFVDPLFADVTKDDFTVKEGSPAIDKAAPLPNINDHFAGAGPDIGCFERGSDWTGRTLNEPFKDDPR